MATFAGTEHRAKANVLHEETGLQNELMLFNYI